MIYPGLPGHYQGLIEIFIDIFINSISRSFRVALRTPSGGLAEGVGC